MEKVVVVDDRQDQYVPFFVDNFAHEAFAASDTAAKLREPIFDLVFDWRSASYAGAMPAQIPVSIKVFHDAFVNSNFSQNDILQYSEVILKKLSYQLPELVADPNLIRRLRQKIVMLSCEIAETTSSIKQEIDAEAIWKQFFDLKPFKLGIHGTMRLVYLAVYGAYENFIVRALSIAHEGKRVRVNHPEFKKDFRAALGPLIETAWFAEDIRVARLVRHALIHAGGRVTKDLQAYEIPLKVSDGYLNIFPEHISQLYNLLKSPALDVMRARRFQ